MREITIREAMNGFKVQVGCQELVFQDKSVMIAELSRYLDKPDDVEREYLKRFAPKGAAIMPGGGTVEAVRDLQEREHNRHNRMTLDPPGESAQAQPAASVAPWPR